MNIPVLLTKLRERLSALGNGRDCRSDTERAAWYASYNETQSCISGLMNAPQDLLREVEQLADLQKRRDAVAKHRDELQRQLAGASVLIEDGRWTEVALSMDPHVRDTEAERQLQLRNQLELMRNGYLLLAPGVHCERLDYLDERIAEVTVRRDRVQSAFDALVRQADALLSAQMTV
jgi:hypothetical protein